MRERKTPMRMCVGCREMMPKRDMVRIVRGVDGTVSVDRTGKLSGRGAYLCLRSECFVRAIKIKALERMLEVSIGEELREALAKELERRAEE